MAVKRTKVTRKVDLRTAYTMGGYSGEYSWFVRTKVIPIIGESALHPSPPRSGSKVREYKVTSKNLNRVIKALGISNTRYSQVRAMKKAVSKAGPDATAEMIIKLVEDTQQPKGLDNFPVNFRIPIHPLSHNMMYEAKGNRMVKTTRYKNWRKHFFKLIQAIVPDTCSGVNLSKPLEVIYRFGHREKSNKGGVFDRPNFQKSAQDCVFEHFKYDDSKVLDSSVRGEFVKEYTDGYIEVSIRNT